MDDKEYYSLMNRSSSWALQQALKKKNKNSQKKPADNLSAGNSSYTHLEALQGSADAQMLMEKAREEE